MVKINIREFTHNFSHYLQQVKSGQRIVVMERNIPVADILPHNENIESPGWKRPIKKLRLCGKPLSETIIQERKDARQ
ncbi:MAG: hypothetical protein NC924_04845 [Candidatus Omnitrophica bacterium]|nr:hypothetical protein [Candidatus Omnitrophota bacterium]